MFKLNLNSLNKHRLIFISRRTLERPLKVLERLCSSNDDMDLDRLIFNEVIRAHKLPSQPNNDVIWPY